MHSLETLRAYFQNDRFAMESGVELLEAAPGYALCRMALRPMHCNSRGTPMGGAIFTLADFASAVAANTESAETQVVSLHADITFLELRRGNTFMQRRSASSTAARQRSTQSRFGTNWKRRWRF